MNFPAAEIWKTFNSVDKIKLKNTKKGTLMTEHMQPNSVQKLLVNSCHLINLPLLVDWVDTDSLEC